MAVFLTADTHFFHKNIVDYCDRPFRTLDGHPDVKAMNEALIEQWNATVRPQAPPLNVERPSAGRRSGASTPGASW